MLACLGCSGRVCCALLFCFSPRACVFGRSVLEPSGFVVCFVPFGFLRAALSWLSFGVACLLVCFAVCLFVCCVLSISLLSPTVALLLSVLFAAPLVSFLLPWVSLWPPWVVFWALWLLSALSGCPWASLVFLLCSLRRSWVSSGFSGLFLVLVGPPPGPFGSLCLLWVSVSPVLF